ncbi:peptidoglycan DD-metalloendopeptidase family protein [Nocardioides terrisoli]|uniref:peptidoglycan DD-metalloendopeptidase family protein n=1 Tax=Nocardioides terrisoli TaxID=3388267 RepID=UPI00287B8AC5|nr:peptidoglycan DD-metalloendopeptidase family protein [Nocardioides marmorisolisilvae]
MNRAAIAIIAAVGLVMSSLIVFETMFGARDDAGCLPTPQLAAAHSGQAGPGARLRLIQANLKISEPTHHFASDLANIVGRDPDFVTLNEVNSRSDGQLTRPGYGMWRAPVSFDGRRSPARETAVLWRADRWTPAARGFIRLTRPVRGHYERLDSRYATWVTLRSASGTQVSVVSAHTMVNPRRDHDTLRKHEDAAGFKNLAWLAQQLQKSGPVLVAGDLNTYYPHNGGPGDEWWGPLPAMTPVGMIPTYRALGKPAAGWATYDRGGTFDWIFYQTGALVPLRQNTFGLYSDHRGVQADFSAARTADAEPSAHANRAAAPALSHPSVAGFDAEQLHNAAAIIAAGQQLGVPLKAKAIALMTAIGESGLRVLDHGDTAGPDSRGLFQQRAGGAWGSLADRMDPRTSSLNFYKALLQVPGWTSLPPTIAAHRTQHNADPSYYTPYWSHALRLLSALTGSSTVQALLADGATASCDTVLAAAHGLGSVTWPVPANLAGTDEHNFGHRGSLWSSFHTGTDFAVPCGTPVYAATSGTVILDHTQAWAGPNLVKIQSAGPGTLTTWYAHMESESVINGQAVTVGQQIGRAGAEGNATGCHLHFEVHPHGGTIYQDPTDPSAWLAHEIRMQ